MDETGKKEPKSFSEFMAEHGLEKPDAENLKKFLAAKLGIMEDVIYDGNFTFGKGSGASLIRGKVSVSRGKCKVLLKADIDTVIDPEDEDMMQSPVDLAGFVDDFMANLLAGLKKSAIMSAGFGIGNALRGDDGHIGMESLESVEERMDAETLSQIAEGLEEKVAQLRSKIAEKQKADCAKTAPLEHGSEEDPSPFVPDEECQCECGDCAPEEAVEDHTEEETPPDEE